MIDGGNTTFVEMARDFPIRTAVFTILPVGFVLIQLALSLVHGGSVLVTTGFSVAILAYAVLANQYHMAVYRRDRISPIGNGYGHGSRSD